MLSTLKTLISGANARAEDALRDTFSVELIEQKIREATLTMKSAKVSLAGLIQRKRSEEQQRDALKSRVDDLFARIKAALDAGETALAQEAAEAVAHMENEVAARQATIERLESRVLRLETSVATAHRRLMDLKQGAVTAKAVQREQAMQAKLGHRATSATEAMDEAEDLIAQVMQRDDPFERSEILREIDDGLSHGSLADRMADKGFGPSNKSTASDVLARLKS